MGCARYYPSAPADLLSILSTLLLRQQADLYGVRDWLVLWLLIGCSQFEAPAGDWRAGRGRSWFGNWVKALHPQSIT